MTKPTKRGDGYVQPPEVRPEYVVCIRSPFYEDGKPSKHSLCGYYVEGWMPPPFEGLDHAFCEVARGGRLLPCPECAAVAVSALSKTEADQ